jgi:archaetidylinositol phosphate synthase
LVSSKLKKRFEETVRAAVAPLGEVGITPNMLTVLGVLLASVTGYVYTLASMNRVYLVYCGVLIIVSGFVDAIDGVLARSTGKVTRFGGFFDSVADRYSDAVIYTGIIVAGLCNQLIGLITLFASMLVSYTRARAEMEGVKMAGIGLAERAERMTFLSICSIMAYWWAPALNYGIMILAALALITVLQRIFYFKKMIEKN